MISWETMGLLVVHGSLLLGLRCNARDSRLYPEGLERGGFELSGDDTEMMIQMFWQRSSWSSRVGASQGCSPGVTLICVATDSFRLCV